MKVLTAQSNKSITALTIKFVHYQNHKIKHIYTLGNENHQHISRSDNIQVIKVVWYNFFVHSEIK